MLPLLELKEQARQSLGEKRTVVGITCEGCSCAGGASKNAAITVRVETKPISSRDPIRRVPLPMVLMLLLSHIGRLVKLSMIS